MSAAIICQKLSRHFGSLRAIDSLDMAVAEGSIYALVGSNGAGKSTLIKLLVNLLKPNGGRAEILGVHSRRITPQDFEQIGYVSENQELPEWMRAGDFLSYWQAFYPQWDQSLADAMLREFAIPPERKIKQLSRGMKMKLALASSLAYRPRLLILDEPFSGLDALARDEFIRGLLDRSEGMTIFLSSHDLAEIETFSTHIGFLENGRLLFSEESALLLEHFREIDFSYEGSLPTNLPKSWLNLQHNASLVRFVDSDFREPAAHERISALFPNAGERTIRPLSLREIFVSLASRSKS